MTTRATARRCACTADATDEILLSRKGKLWTWTVQRFPPPAPPFIGDPESFVPFGVGYVERPEGIRVEARLTENGFAILYELFDPEIRQLVDDVSAIVSGPSESS